MEKREKREGAKRRENGDRGRREIVIRGWLRGYEGR